MKKLIWIFTILIILSGCSAQSSSPYTSTPITPTPNPPTLQPTLTNTTPPPPTATFTQPVIELTPEQIMPLLPSESPSSNLNTLIENAIQDLAQRLSIETSQITVLEAQEVVWPNSSLGCPLPGMFYTDVLTPGYLIRLGANNTEFEYHASMTSEIMFCKNPQPPVPGMPDDI
ncbi:hypothetical protein KQH54_00615 [bacterium]|nr:hypothetical protein [bacterium]